MKNYKEGFYYFTSEDEPEPILVHGYYCTDLQGDFVFGFNTYDGGELLRADDLTDNTIVTPVEILSSKRRSDLDSIIDVQCSTGNWDYDSYMHGLANGMLLTKAAVFGGEYSPLDAPEVWLESIKTGENPESISSDS